MMEIVVLRLVHVLGGTFWVGSGLLTGLFLMPALMAAGPSAAKVMDGLRHRGLFTVLPWIAVLTIASGLRLMWIVSGGFDAAYFTTPRGATFAASGLAATIAFCLTLLVTRPAGARSGALAAALAASGDEAERARITAELARVRRRSAVAGTAGIWLLIASAAGMGVARYLG